MTAGTRRELTLSRVSVEYNAEGEPLEMTCSFTESGGMAFFELRGSTAKYDGHVHSVDREKAEEAVGKLPFVNEVDMEYER